jgi:hypothetical protein
MSLAQEDVTRPARKTNHSGLRCSQDATVKLI